MTTAALQITDFLVESADRGMVPNAMFINQSAAFDCVEAEILNKKLELYKFSSNMREWISSYLELRSQYVNIGSANSRMRTVGLGVPQGSVLGPILYSLYTNELPESSKDRQCPKECHQDRSDLFGRNCGKCGLVPCYADDLTVVVESKNPDENKDKLIEKLDNISNFLQNNGLCVNKDKTKCQNYMVKQKYVKVVCCDPLVMTVEAGENEVKDIINQEQVRILGLNLQRDYSWRAHLETGGRPLLQSLRSRIGALKHLGNVIPMNGRQQLVNGLIISKLIYMIQDFVQDH